MRLSVLVCSTLERADTFLPKQMVRLRELKKALPYEQQKQVQILCLVDDQTLMLGDKRNILTEMAQGEYTVSVDDDDRLTDDYLTEILKAIETGADCITYKVSVSLNGGDPKICHYSKSFNRDYNTEDAYYRLPNHLAVVKKEVSRNVSFPALKYAEDVAYAKILKPHIRTEHIIDKVLYHYDYNDQTTIAQEDLPAVKRRRRINQTPIVDLVFLSNAKSRAFRAMTQQAIDTAIAGANGLAVNCIVIEQQQNVAYSDAITIRTVGEFNYNQFANKGARHGKAEWIMIANNDLIFKNGWLHQLLGAEHPAVSPKCPKDSRQSDVVENETGYTNGRHFSGWCFMIKRSIYDKIGGFDERVSFWCSDDLVIEQLKGIEIEPMIVANSLVEHLGSTTLKTHTPSEQGNMCWGNVDKFNHITGQSKFSDNRNFQEWKSRQSQSV